MLSVCERVSEREVFFQCLYACACMLVCRRGVFYACVLSFWYFLHFLHACHSLLLGRVKRSAAEELQNNRYILTLAGMCRNIHHLLTFILQLAGSEKEEKHYQRALFFLNCIIFTFSLYFLLVFLFCVILLKTVALLLCFARKHLLYSCCMKARAP